MICVARIILVAPIVWSLLEERYALALGLIFRRVRHPRLDRLGSSLVLSDRHRTGRHHHQRQHLLPANRRPHPRRAHRRKQTEHRLPDPVRIANDQPRLARPPPHTRPTAPTRRDPSHNRNQHSPVRNNRIQPSPSSKTVRVTLTLALALALTMATPLAAATLCPGSSPPCGGRRRRLPSGVAGRGFV